MPDYIDERDGQLDFYRRFLPRINPDITEEEIINEHTDGLINGNILEFKLNMSDLNETLFQTIKYLSTLRIKGKPVPKNIIIINLVSNQAWVFDSADYLPDIEKVYFDSASKNNAGFIGKAAKMKLDLNNMVDQEKMVKLLRENNYTKIHIDENCILGWAKRFYELNPNARKEHFIGDKTGITRTVGEIREPYEFKDYIYPYEGKSNVRFEYLMDKLNDTLSQRNLGAFYTPTPYVEKSLDLLRKAIARVPEGNDYIILDRCAGTGNLEKLLTDEELSHCIVSTKEYYEYKVLLELLGSKVRHIIPTIEEHSTYKNGMVNGADALTQEYVENPIIKQYLDDPNCTVILFENPPYVETTGVENQRAGKGAVSSNWKNSYVVQNMRKELQGTVLNDLAHAFIWSGFKYYLRQPTDSYVLFSPIKYWKGYSLINKKFIDGYALNRSHFHARTPSCTLCILWSNEDDTENFFDRNGFEVRAFDIPKNEDKTEELDHKLSVKKAREQYSAHYYDYRKSENTKNGHITVGLNGLEKPSTVNPDLIKVNDDILGYMSVHNRGFDNPDLNSSLLVAMRYDNHGFYIYRDNYLEKLPMFAASRYVSLSDNPTWTEKGLLMRTSDGWQKYEEDLKSGKLDEYLLKVLLFTCMVAQNHMRTFHGSDGVFYRNELTLDTTNGPTQASIDLERMNPDEEEQRILDLFYKILREAKETENYNPEYTYGLFQIDKELNTSHKETIGNKVENVKDYLELNADISTMKNLVKDYFNHQIAPTLFEYEFVK